MFYRAWIHTPNPQEESISLSDTRSAAELGAALATEGYLVSKRGEVSFAAYNDGQTTYRMFNFKGTGQVVLFPRHLIRIDEIVLEPGTNVTET